jgi:hypothetical protein
MDKHTKEYKLKSTPDDLPDHYRCCNTVFDDEDSWANHVVDRHCRSPDMLGSRPLTRTYSAASLQGVSTPGSSSGRYLGNSSYQGTPGSGLTKNTSVSGTESRRCSDVLGLYGGSPKPSELPVSFEDAPAPTSQPRFHLELPYLPQTVASTSLPNEQFPLATDGSGNFLFDYNGNEIFRTYDGFLVSGGYAGLTPILHSQPLYAYDGSGTTHSYWYGVNIK